MIINLALLLVFVVAAVAVFRVGLVQGGGIFLAVLLAATLATGWYEAFAAYLEKYLPDFAAFLDVAALWLLFAGLVILLAAPLGLIFRTRVAFAQPVELAGSIVLAILTGWTVAEFTAAFGASTRRLSGATSCRCRRRRCSSG